MYSEFFLVIQSSDKDRTRLVAYDEEMQIPSRQLDDRIID
jgi:hypothetical protein